MPVSLSSTLVDAGLVPLYLFGATSIVRGVPYCVAVPAEPQSLPHPVANGAPLSPNLTDSLICRSNTTCKLLSVNPIIAVVSAHESLTDAVSSGMRVDNSTASSRHSVATTTISQPHL